MSAKYHPGEIEVQERVGMRAMAERVGNSIRPTIPPAAHEFLKEQVMVVVGSVDAGGRVWASLLVGEPGFLWAPDERTVRIAATPLPGDPLAEPLRRAGTKVGVIAIDLATRRHVRFMDENTLQFPDYSGNTAFNTPGNIAANPSAGPLFLDFERGVTLQLTGGARIVWDAWRAARFAGGERVVEFRLQKAVETLGAVPLRWRFRG